MSPSETLILEDSHIGRKSALMSGAHLLPIDTPKSVTLSNILSRAQFLNDQALLTSRRSQFQKCFSDYNIVVPMVDDCIFYKLVSSYHCSVIIYF